NITRVNTAPLGLRNSDIYLMDIRNFTWVNSFDIFEYKIDEPKKYVKKIVIAVICSMLSIGILAICGVLLYRWQKFRRVNHKFEQKNNQHLPDAVISNPNNN
ncbi:5187_t:CDS:1, partial [Funneliformis mosseae]